MIEFKDLTRKEVFEVYNEAINFLHDNSDYVYNIVDTNTTKVIPNGLDLFDPESWTNHNWKWFIDKDWSSL